MRVWYPIHMRPDQRAYAWLRTIYSASDLRFAALLGNWIALILFLDLIGARDLQYFVSGISIPLIIIGWMIFHERDPQAQASPSKGQWLQKLLILVLVYTPLAIAVYILDPGATEAFALFVLGLALSETIERVLLSRRSEKVAKPAK